MKLLLVFGALVAALVSLLVFWGFSAGKEKTAYDYMLAINGGPAAKPVLIGRAVRYVQPTKDEITAYRTARIKDFVRYIDAQIDSFPPYRYETETIESWVQTGPVMPWEWAAEIIPYFTEEKIVTIPVIPDEIDYYWFGPAQIYLLGQAACEPGQPGGWVALNLRYINPYSVWYGEVSYLSTLIHELGHIQGEGLCEGDTATVESTTQLVTLEVAAAMTNHGNLAALPTLLDDLRAMGLSTLQYYASWGSDQDMAEFMDFRNEILSRPSEIAERSKYWRYWEEHISEFRALRLRYARIPFESVVAGLAAGEIPNLPLPEFIDYGLPKNKQHLSDDYGRRALRIDDLVYLLRHMDELVGEFRASKIAAG